MIIYKATCLVNSKCYVGQTNKSLEKRINEHKSSNLLYAFHKALKKYGFENFKWEILCVCENRNELNEMEKLMIKEHHSHISENGYNLATGGNAAEGYKHTEEQKEKKRKVMKTLWQTPEFRQKQSDNHKGFTGKHFTDESKKRIGDGHRGKKYNIDLELRRKIMLNNGLGAKDWYFKWNNIEIEINNLKKFCLENNFPYRNTKYQILKYGEL